MMLSRPVLAPLARTAVAVTCTVASTFTAIAALAGFALGQVRVGSFVSGERPMYLEVSPFVDGQAVHLQLRNVPTGAKSPLLVWSYGVNLLDLTPGGTPGYLGPDLTQGAITDLDPNNFTLDDVLPTGLGGTTLYLQAYIKVKHGGRLSSMTTVHVINPGDDPGTAPHVKFPLPLTVEEVLPPKIPGFARTRGPVRVGVPLPIGEVFASNGVPQLTLLGGATEAQFSTLASWPDGSVKWALCEWLCDLPADGLSTAFSVDRGAGNFGGPDLASLAGNVIAVDTGALQVAFDPATPNLFDQFDRNHVAVLDAARGNAPHYWDDLDQEWTWNEATATLRRNGPVRAEIEVAGYFTRSASSSDPDRVHARFYVELCKGSTTVRVTASLRATAISFPEHLLFRGFTYRAFRTGSGPLTVSYPQTNSDGLPLGLWSGTLPTVTDDASMYQGFAKLRKDELCSDPNWSTYVPWIERFGNDSFAMEGVRTRIGSNYYTGDASTNYWTAENSFADPTFMELSTSTGAALLAGVEHAKYYWPLELQAGGDGRIEFGLLPRKDAADSYDYALTYASAETRVFWLAAEDAPSADPIAAAATVDYPLGARANQWVYNQADVWPWKLITKAEVDSYCALSGLKKPVPPATDLVRTIYEYSNATGGASNNWEETRRFYQWLRGGDGGAHMSSLLEAYYKADKMPWAIDDGLLKNRTKVRNGTVMVTKKDDYYNNSKHTYWQVVADWALARGDSYLLDTGRFMAETIVDKGISPNVQPHGNFVSGTYGAIVDAAAAVLDYYPDSALESWVHDVCFQWSNVVFQVDNSFGVDTSQLGWQAAIGTDPGSSLNPDGYMITWAAGKSSDKAQWGYTTQGWTDLRNGAQSYERVVHYLREHSPTDPLIDDLLSRGEDWYHYAHRSIRDDYQYLTGDLYNIDVFAGDGGNPNVDPFTAPGPDIDSDDQSGYALQAIVNLKLEHELSSSAFSYGVETHRSISNHQYDQFINDPVLEEFIWRYLVHYGLLKP